MKKEFLDYVEDIIKAIDKSTKFVEDINSKNKNLPSK